MDNAVFGSIENGNIASEGLGREARTEWDELINGEYRGKHFKKAVAQNEVSDGVETEGDEVERKTPDELMETREGRIELNKRLYNEMEAFLKVVYEREGGGFSIPYEYVGLGEIQTCLERGIDDRGGRASPVMTDDGYAIDRSYKKWAEGKGPSGLGGLYEKIAKKEPELVEAAKGVEFDTVDFDYYKELIDASKTALEMEEVLSELRQIRDSRRLPYRFGNNSLQFYSLETIATIDKDLLDVAEAKECRLYIEEHDTERAQLRAEMKAYAEMADEMENMYESAGIFEKIRMRREGYKQRIEEVRARMEQCQKKVDVFDNDKWYEDSLARLSYLLDGETYRPDMVR